MGGTHVRHAKAIRNLALVTALVAGATGCTKPEEILTGLREDPRSPGYNVDNAAAVATATERAAADVAPFANRSVAANLGPLTNVASWTHRGGSASHLLPHAALSAQPQVLWAARAGEGNERKYRITAEPVSDGSRIFTMDSHAQVVATSTAGATLWSAKLDAPGERAGYVTGGGLALGDGKLFATTSQSELIALDPASGAVLWRQKFPAALQGAPTVSGGQVYVTTAASQAFAVKTDTGRIAWQLAGIASQSGVSGVAAPAVAGSSVVFPLANGSLIGVDVGDGKAKWVARVLGDRNGAAHAVLQDFTGEPVISGNTAYVATPAGRVAAVGLDGKVQWSAEQGAQGLLAVAGGSLYFVTDQGKLVRLSARDGEMIWSVDLPRYVKFDKPRKLKSIYPGYGPVLAGGKLWVASGDGGLRGFDPASGAMLSQVALPAGAAARPIVVGGALYVMTEKGQLVALR